MASSSSRLSSYVSTVGCFQFDFRRFSSHLSTLFLGRSLVYSASLASTQASAIEELNRNQFISGHLILADRQSAGRGRLSGRHWLSPPSSNLYFSLCLGLTSAAALPIINFAAALSVAEAIRSATLNRVPALVKWPNDIYAFGRKLSGILIDVQSNAGEESETQFSAAIGVGINVYQRFSECSDPMLSRSAISVVDALAHLDAEFVDPSGLRELVLANFLNCFERNLDRPWEELRREYQQLSAIHSDTELLVMPNKREDESGAFAARMVEITEDGFLKVKKVEGGEIITLVAEEVGIRVKQ